MENQIIKIGVIKYKNYEERVLLNESFVVEDLIKIIETEPMFVNFQILDKDEVILWTDYEDQEDFNKYFNLERKHYTVISQENTYNELDAYCKKNKIKYNVDGFGDSNVGGDHDMFTFPKTYKRIIVNANYNLNRYGGTKFNVELEHPKIKDHYFNIFESKSFTAVLSFLKRRAGNYDTLIKKEDKRLQKQRQAEFEQYKRDCRRYGWK